MKLELNQAPSTNPTVKVGRKVIHWLAFAFLVYEIGYASLWKVLQKPEMVDGMDKHLGFSLGWTLVIGYAELIGLILLILGLWKRPLKNLGGLIIMPFVIGAFTVHIGHSDPFASYWASLLCCFCVAAMWVCDEEFKVKL